MKLVGTMTTCTSGLACMTFMRLATQTLSHLSSSPRPRTGSIGSLAFSLFPGSACACFRCSARLYCQELGESTCSNKADCGETKPQHISRGSPSTACCQMCGDGMWLIKNHFMRAQKNPFFCHQTRRTCAGATVAWWPCQIFTEPHKPAPPNSSAKRLWNGFHHRSL